MKGLHPHHVFIIIVLVFIIMWRAVKVINIELNAFLAISIIFLISSSHFPPDVIVCPKIRNIILSRPTAEKAFNVGYMFSLPRGILYIFTNAANVVLYLVFTFKCKNTENM